MLTFFFFGSIFFLLISSHFPFPFIPVPLSDSHPPGVSLHPSGVRQNCCQMLSSDAWLLSHLSACWITNSPSLSLSFSPFLSSLYHLALCTFLYIFLHLSPIFFSSPSLLFSDFCCILMMKFFQLLTLSEVQSHLSSFFRLLVSQFLPVRCEE